jgi:hypothetical protein
MVAFMTEKGKWTMPSTETTTEALGNKPLSRIGHPAKHMLGWMLTSLAVKIGMVKLEICKNPESITKPP